MGNLSIAHIDPLFFVAPAGTRPHSPPCEHVTMLRLMDFHSFLHACPP